jgi:hypothetical protein
MQLIKIKKWNIFCVDPKTTIQQATKKLNKLEIKTLLVCNNKNYLIGTITDGDLRRSIINGFHFKSIIGLILNNKPIVVNKPNEVILKKKYILEHDIQLLPCVNKLNIIKNVFFIKNLDLDKRRNSIDNPVLIMAGGKGKRLGKLTRIIPKPLLKFNNSSVLEKIIDNFLEQKFYNISIALHHLAKKIKSKLLYYENKIQINFIEEKKPLGTIGALALIDNKINNLLPIIVINADIISNINFQNILKFHNSSKAEITIVAKEYEIKNPYGVLEVKDKNMLKNIVEKPSVYSLINAGIYIFNPNLIKYIKKNSPMDMDALLRKLVNIKKKILIYKLRDYWYEIGTTKEYSNFKNLVKY